MTVVSQFLEAFEASINAKMSCYNNNLFISNAIIVIIVSQRPVTVPGPVEQSSPHVVGLIVGLIVAILLIILLLLLRRYRTSKGQNYSNMDYIFYKKPCWEITLRQYVMTLNSRGLVCSVKHYLTYFALCLFFTDPCCVR